MRHSEWHSSAGQCISARENQRGISPLQHVHQIERIACGKRFMLLWPKYPHSVQTSRHDWQYQGRGMRAVVIDDIGSLDWTC
jgi:hypothetical protein